MYHQGISTNIAIHTLGFVSSQISHDHWNAYATLGPFHISTYLIILTQGIDRDRDKVPASFEVWANFTEPFLRYTDTVSYRHQVV